MAINTKSAVGRRTLHFNSLDEVVADAERLKSSPKVTMLGNWPLGQLFTHLATAVNNSIDGFPGQAPWFIRIIARRFKRRFISRPMSPGFKLPKKIEAGFFPDASTDAGFEELRCAIGRVHTERMTANHPALGPMTHEEWLQVHLRHSELHLSFAVPS